MLQKAWHSLAPLCKMPLRTVKNYLSGGKVVFQAQTPFSFLQVVDKNNLRYLVFYDKGKPRRRQNPDAIYQSRVSLSNPSGNTAAYTDYFHFAWLFNEKIKKILMVGLGGGAAVTTLLNNFPDSDITTVEIDPVVAMVAFQYFFLVPDHRHQVIINDGRNYIEKTCESFDLLILDAFYADSIPHHLFTKEFLWKARKRLTENGLLVLNINSSLRGPDSILFRSIYKTLMHVFPQTYLFASKKETPQRFQNIISISMQRQSKLSPSVIKERAMSLSGRISVDNFTEKTGTHYDAFIDTDDVSVLTDIDPPAGGLLRL